MFIEVSKTSKARDIFIMIRILNNQPGKGMISMATIKITLNSTDRSLADIVFLSLNLSICITYYIFCFKRYTKAKISATALKNFSGTASPISV